MPEKVTWQPWDDIYFYSVRIPRDQKWQPMVALRSMELLLGQFPAVILWLFATERSILWRLLDMERALDPDQVAACFQSVYPGAVIDRAPFLIGERPAFHRAHTYFALEYPIGRPLPYVTDFRQFDPLASFVHSVNSLAFNERVSLFLPIAGPVGSSGMGRGMFNTLVRAGHKNDTQEIRNRYEEKIQGQNYGVIFLIVQCDSPDPSRLKDLVRLTSTPLTQHYRRALPPNALKVVGTQTFHVSTFDEQLATSAVVVYDEIVAVPLDTEQKIKQRFPYVSTMELLPLELAALWHLPHEDMTASRIAWNDPPPGELPETLLGKNDGVLIGTGSYQNQPFPVYITDHDRNTHMNIVGKTGVGKTTFLHNFIHQDIARGEGVAVIDPTGNLIRALLQNSIPQEREIDVVVLDIYNEDFPPPFNPLRTAKGYIGTGKVIDAIEHLYQGSTDFVRLSKFLRAALDALHSDPSPTIRDLSRIFRDTTYRTNLLKTIESDFTYEVWDDYEEYSDGLQIQIREPIVNRLSPFWANPILYPMFCHPDALDFQELIKAKKIVLISLYADADRIPEQERNLIGSLLISQLQTAGMKDTKNPYRIYIDEVQKYVTTSLNVMLAEARQFGLSLTIANQFLGQLQGDTLKAVMGNVGATIAFQVGLDDAKELTPYMDGKFAVEDIINLNQHHAAVKMRYMGDTLPAFSITTPDPLPHQSDGDAREQRIRQLSIQQYTPKSRADVLDWLRKRYPRKGTGAQAEPSSDPQSPSDDSGYYEPK